MAGGRTEGVDAVVERADEHAAVGDGRGRVERAVPAVRPENAPAARRECHHLAAVVSDEQAAAAERDGSLDCGPGRRAPERATGTRCEPPDLPVPVADHDLAVDDQG